MLVGLPAVMYSYPALPQSIIDVIAMTLPFENFKALYPLLFAWLHWTDGKLTGAGAEPTVVTAGESHEFPISE
jgi:hypothetical protein